MEKSGEKQKLEEIAEEHIEKGFWHIGKSDSVSLSPFSLGMKFLGDALAVLGATYFMDESVISDFFLPYAVTSYGLPFLSFGGEIFIDRLIHRDEGKRIIIDVSDRDNKIEERGIFSVCRHPLYSMKLAGTTTLNFIALNPVNWFLGVKSLYHLTRGVKEEETGISLLHRNYEDYKRKVPSFVPSDENYIFKLMKKVFPEKVVGVLFEEPNEKELSERVFNPYKGTYYFD